MCKKHPIFATFLAVTTILFCPNTIDAGVTTPPFPQRTPAVKIGQASWYSEKSPGINKHTANNEIFDDSQLTAAMWDVPFNQMIKVTNLENEKSVVVRVNDRGPHKRYVRAGRIIDLSKEAFSTIAPLKKGLISIRLEFL